MRSTSAILLLFLSLGTVAIPLSRRTPPSESPANDGGTVIHELTHILGLTHEHQRPDRPAFVVTQPAPTSTA